MWNIYFSRTKFWELIWDFFSMCPSHCFNSALQQNQKVNIHNQIIWPSDSKYYLITLFPQTQGTQRHSSKLIEREEGSNTWEGGYLYSKQSWKIIFKKYLVAPQTSRSIFIALLVEKIQWRLWADIYDGGVKCLELRGSILTFTWNLLRWAGWWCMLHCVCCDVCVCIYLPCSTKQPIYGAGQTIFANKQHSLKKNNGGGKIIQCNWPKGEIAFK